MLNLRYIKIFITILCIAIGTELLYPATPTPDAEATLKMSEKEIATYAEKLNVLELKQWADSIYFRTDLRTFPRSTAEPIYRQLILRAAKPISAEEEKIMAAGYSNYATYLIFEKNNPVLAYPLLRRSLELLDKYKDDGLLVVGAYTNMAHIYANFNDTVKALNHLKNGFQRAIESSTPRRAGYIYAQLLLMAWEFNHLSDIKPEMEIFKKSEAIRDGYLYEYNLDLTRSIEEYEAGNFEKASELAKHSLNHIDAEYDPQIYRSMTLLMSADAALKGGLNKEARQLIDSATIYLAGYRELNGNDFLNRIEARYCRQTGNPAAAYDWEIRSLILRDSLYNARNMTTIADLEQDMITSRFNTELREAQLQEALLREKSSRQQAIMIIMAIASIIIISLLLFLMYKRRKLNECRYDLILKELQPSVSHVITNSHEPQSGMVESNGPALNISPDNEKESRNSELNPKEEKMMAEIFSKVKDFMETSAEIYAPGFSIDLLSESLAIPVKQISKSINIHSGKNFSLFLSEYRIKEACRILIEATPDKRPTIESVAEQVGYRSRSHFSRTFKSITGLTTTDFLRQTQRHSK